VCRYPLNGEPRRIRSIQSVLEKAREDHRAGLKNQYKDGEKKIIVPPDAPIVAFAPGDKGDLKPGVKIFIVAAKKQADGSLQAPRINYGKDGLTPPM
jgi:hypothetical protein